MQRKSFKSYKAMYNFTYIPKEEQDLDDKLINLYASHLLDLYSAERPIYESNDYPVKPALPFLLWLKDDAKEWIAADVKILIYGRETNGWEDGNPKSETYKISPNWELKDSDDIRKEVDAIQEIYNAFFNFLTQQEKSNKYFDRGFYPLLRLLEDAFPQKKVNCVWNDISKIGNGNDIQGKKASRGLPESYIHYIEMANFNVSQAEIDILQPDVVIFLAGKNADSLIKEKFGVEEFVPISYDYPDLAVVDIKNAKFALRAGFNHPSVGLSNETMGKYYPKIAELIKERFE